MTNAPTVPTPETITRMTEALHASHVINLEKFVEAAAAELPGATVERTHFWVSLLGGYLALTLEYLDASDADKAHNLDRFTFDAGNRLVCPDPVQAELRRILEECTIW